MKAFNGIPLPSTPWFATMRCIDGGEIIEEALFDSSVTSEA
jgi:hypothetical protein